MKTANSTFIRDGLSAMLFLGAVIPIVFGVLMAISELLPMHENVLSATGLVLAVGGLVLGGGLWGRRVARRIGYARPNVLFWATGATFALGTFLAVMALGRLEQFFVEERRGGDVPIHVLFAILFTGAAFVVTGLIALVMGRVAADGHFALKLALWSGAAAALAFLLADIAQDLLGRRVGGPGAARTFTMLSVMMIGNLIAAFAGGGVMGWMFSARRDAGAQRVAQP